MTAFTNRTSAGRSLAAKLANTLRTTEDVLVLALPRGGVPVAAAIARTLDAELDLMIVRKLGLPWHQELAMGAIASGGIRILNQDIVRDSGVSQDAIERVARDEQQELARRDKAYRGDRPAPRVKDRTVILVDDGIATGATMFAAMEAIRRQAPRQLIVAVPVAPPDTIERVEAVADDVVVLLTPSPFYAIGQWYQDFSQTSDEEVRALLEQAWKRQASKQEEPS